MVQRMGRYHVTYDTFAFLTASNHSLESKTRKLILIFVKIYQTIYDDMANNSILLLPRKWGGPVAVPVVKFLGF